MGTIAVVRELLAVIQGERHPIYRASLRRRPVISVNVNALGGCALLLLLFIAPILTCLEGQFGLYVATYVDVALTTLVLAAGGLLSLCWTVPLALLAGTSIARERVSQTWDVLLTTPFTTESILLAKAAAAVRNVWTLVVGTAFFGTLLALFFASPVIASMATQINQSLMWGVLLMVFGMAAVVVEHEQEIALAVVLGLVISLRTDSPRMAVLAGLAGGLLIRIVQLVLTFMLVPPEPALSMQNVITMNLIAGSATLLAVLPMLGAVAFVTLMIVGRELLVRWLFGWAVRHASGA